MSRSGYTDDCEDILAYGRWKAQVASSIRGQRGQSFLRELAAALDAMPVKKLIAEELISKQGEVCAIGAVCKSRGLDVSGVDIEDSTEVGKLVNISRQMAAEIEYENDEGVYDETPGQRWVRMRKWVADNLLTNLTSKQKE